LNVGKNLLKFLNDIEELVIYYGCEDLINGLQSIKYYDSDFIDDKKSFKSIYNYIFKFTKDPINWKSKRTFIITLSTLEAETDVFIEDIRKVF